MSTAERRVQLLNLIQAVMPALVEQLVQPEPPKPKVEHKVVAYSFMNNGGEPVSFDVAPPQGDGWKLSQLDLPNALGHWTRVVMVESDDDQGDTISSPPPDLEPEPEAAKAPPAGPILPCALCGQYPHSSSCSLNSR